MTETPPSPQQSLATEQIKPIPLVLPPLLTEDPQIIKRLKDDFGFQFERPQNPPLPTNLDPSLLGDNPDLAITFIRQISRYPRTGFLYYPGEKEIADNPVEMERQELKEWTKLEDLVAKKTPELYPAIQENRFRINVVTLPLGYMEMLYEQLPDGSRGLVDLEEIKKITDEVKENYRDYTLKQREEFGQDVAEFIAETLWQFSPQPQPTPA